MVKEILTTEEPIRKEDTPMDELKTQVKPDVRPVSGINLTEKTPARFWRKGILRRTSRAIIR
jgi:hypothetical protein